MSDFNCRVREKAPAGDTSLSSSAQFSGASPQGVLTSTFRDMMLMRKVSGEFYETLREKIPIYDTAINKLVSMNGTLKIIGDNGPLVAELEDFLINAPVNDHQKGLNAAQANASNEAFEQGFAYLEMIATPDLKDMAEIRVADSKYITFRLDDNGRSEPWYNPYRQGLDRSRSLYRGVQSNIMQAVNRSAHGLYSAGSAIPLIGETKLNTANKLYFSFNNENTDPHGTSIIRSTEFCASVLATIQTSFLNVFRRWGDPSFHVDYKTSKKSLGTDTLESRRQDLEQKFHTIARAKAGGYSADLVTAHGPEDEVKVTVIGSDGKMVMAEVPLRHVLEQIVGRTGLPAWMLGIYWSTTERMASLEVEGILQDAKIRQFAMLPEYLRLCETFLKLRGRTWKTINTTQNEDKPGDWGLKFEIPNLRDQVALADAEFKRAQAAQMRAGAGVPTPIVVDTPKPTPVPPPKKSVCDCEHDHVADAGKVIGSKETRPFPWPELDQVEARYETRLRSDWQELAVKLFTICKLDPSGKAPGDEAFTFSEEQRAQILKEMESLIGTYHFDDPDSPLRMYYGESYSLGLIQAAQLVGETRPILDIIKNREIYDELVSNGFQLLKDNITRAIQDRIVAEMEAHTIAGTNPLNVAERLNKLFGDQNSSWERLARTEMADAAERAKTDEWKAWKVKKVDFVPAPDACPICTALKGEYKIEECPVIPVHPRCRCSKRPAKSETA